jgi:hypothetical protein
MRVLSVGCTGFFKRVLPFLFKDLLQRKYAQHFEGQVTELFP